MSLDARLAPHGLFDMGRLPDDGDTVILVGAGPGMWPIFTASPECKDAAPDPLDRWSKRVLGALAADLDGSAQFPSDGPPYLPFIAWATATGRFWQSPTGMLIHDTAGLMISIRGALRLPAQQILAVEATNPCDTCAEKPCLGACPVDALSADHAYDVPACKAHITAPEGADCLNLGCRVRRACPVSQRFGRDPAQSAFHMRAFVKA